MVEEVTDVKKPVGIGKRSNHDILTDQPIIAINKLKDVSDDEFEDIVREWVWGYMIKKELSGYIDCKKCAGSGDLGRDIIAIRSLDGPDWDNYQCKNYRAKISPSQLWGEIGKFVYHAYKKRFSLPKNYYVVSGYGPGPDLINYTENPGKFKAELLANWDSHCATKISRGKTYPLDQDLKTYIEAIDFKMFQFIDPQQLIEEHAKTRYHYSRFGGSMPDRLLPPGLPPEVRANEITYVNELLDAYTDHKKTVISLANIESDATYMPHFTRQRHSFYLADSLNEFSKDQFAEYTNHFEALKLEIHSGVVDVCESAYPDRFSRVKAVTQEAKRLSITGNPLVKVMRVEDREGLCHHLVTDKQLTWKGEQA
ncbi:hypothetical protein SAMN06265348_10624 [Pedobacter westerhofensis]|uniref:ABC-three component systems C-terminal domain-containing protein n=1 Tax=Pedobacter westerhofensis TaxID=425512 RepID=A0A521DN79_9SPHI|nr:ABC-three component system protein [Pedobacter westerhofensis]SMO73166.1 hypothetical protein SAMN06265348_10624 [Pedobacter westerhofensis]